MRNAIMSAAILSAGLLVNHAAALAPSAAVAPGAAAAPAPIREAAIVCGGNGCAPVQTKAQQKRKFQPLGHG